MKSPFFLVRPLLVTGLLANLAACGGGGLPVPSLGSSEDGISLAAGEVSCNADPAQQCQSSLRAQPIARLYEGGFKWSEAAAGATPAVFDVNRIKQSDGSWLLHIDFKNALPAGVYRGSITLSFPILSPFGDTINSRSFNYTLTVAGANANLTPLARITTDWEGFNGNATHTGYVPLTLDTASFTRRFSRASPDNTRFEKIAVADGKVLLTSIDGNGAPNAPTNPAILSYREQDNTLLWRVAGTPSGRYFNLAAGGTQVLASDGQSGGRVLSSFDSSTGSLRFSHTDSFRRLSSSNNEMPATVAGASLCAINGTEGELQCFDSASGNVVWSAPQRELRDPLYVNVAPAITDTLVMSNLNGKFRSYDRSSGALKMSIPVPGVTSGTLLTIHELNQAVVAVDANSALLLDQRNIDGTLRNNILSMADLAAQKIRWQASGQFTAHPVAARGVVYVANQQTQSIEARDAATGALQWSWALPAADDDAFGDNLIVTNNLLFVSAKHNTWALDLATHQEVWRYHFGGKLALSAQGVLYILGPDMATQPVLRDWLVAINLK